MLGHAHTHKYVIFMLFHGNNDLQTCLSVTLYVLCLVVKYNLSMAVNGQVRNVSAIICMYIRYRYFMLFLLYSCSHLLFKQTCVVQFFYLCVTSSCLYQQMAASAKDTVVIHYEEVYYGKPVYFSAKFVLLFFNL